MTVTVELHGTDTLQALVHEKSRKLRVTQQSLGELQLEARAEQALHIGHGEEP
jgi:hypothetical protein